VRQILRNLIQNAVRHGGPNVAVETATKDGAVYVMVLDDGPAISSHVRETIFEPYAQASDDAASSPQGVGIGLYVSRLLARLMGGDLVCLRRGDQTEFRLTLLAAERITAELDEPVPVG
ncbi:MAG TPA: ATP-binding protein, partial [Acidimicrobiia bacterium]|nr:ATP-binding protein [Acidimicrobiia bacterium]